MPTFDTVEEQLARFSESIPSLKLDPDHPGVEIENATAKIDGCLFPGEEIYLAQLAKNCSGKGVIVEIGSYLGRSTVSLGLGSMQGSRTMIFTYDHFMGDPYMDVTLQQYELLKNNILQAGVETIVITSTKPSNVAVKDFKDPIELLFIDADHTFEAVENDYLLWSPKVISGGFVAFHDTFDPVMGGLRFTGPLRVIQKYCVAPEWKIVGRFQAITVVQKTEMVPLKPPEFASKSQMKRIKAQKGIK
jgi:predicted O-methyltransferase YrrM